MVIIIESRVFESNGVKRLTIPKAVSDHLKINKADDLYLFVIGNIICYATTREAISEFLSRIQEHISDFFVV